MHPEIATLPTGGNPDPGWVPVYDVSGPTGTHVKGHVPAVGDFDLFYFYTNLPNGTDWDITRLYNQNFCDSREVVFDTPVPHEIQIDPVFKLTLDFAATGQTGWVNSALYLHLHSN